MKAPTGSPIVGTDELIPGCAMGSFDNGEFHHQDETNVYWDGQETVTIAGQTVYVDENGQTWLESQLIADDAEPLPPSQIKPWHADERLLRTEIKNTLDALFQRCGVELQPDGRAYLVAMIVGELNLTRPKEAP